MRDWIKLFEGSEPTKPETETEETVECQEEASRELDEAARLRLKELSELSPRASLAAEYRSFMEAPDAPMSFVRKVLDNDGTQPGVDIEGNNLASDASTEDQSSEQDQQQQKPGAPNTGQQNNQNQQKPGAPNTGQQNTAAPAPTAPQGPQGTAQSSSTIKPGQRLG